MSEKLTIRNFGPIKDMSFEFKKINVFIGDQGTGKSTVAKLLSALKGVLLYSSNFKLIINGEIATEEKEMDFFLDQFRQELEIYGILNYLKYGSFIEFGDSLSSLKYEKEKIIFKKYAEKENNKHTNLISYIPAYREAAVLLKDDLNAISAVGTTLPKLFYYFGQKFSVAKKAKSLYNYTDVLGVKYKYVGNNDIIVMKDGDEILIEDASSAINSGIPLLIVFDNAIESMYSKGNRNYTNQNCPYIIVEEPELNCFPATQKKMMEHFILKLKYEISSGFDYYCRLVITTHSPYILTSLNNLMFAYQVGQTHEEETNKIIEKKYWQNPEDVSAYMMLPNGECESIIDKEGLIKTEKLDSVSVVLNKEFNEIFDIELAIKK